MPAFFNGASPGPQRPEIFRLTGPPDVPFNPYRLNRHMPNPQESPGKRPGALNMRTRNVPVEDSRIARIADIIADHRTAPNLWLARRILEELRSVDACATAGCYDGIGKEWCSEMASRDFVTERRLDS